MIVLVWAESANGVIGKGGKIPWEVPLDLTNFKKLTKNQILLMGSKTYNSIDRELPKQKTIILTTDPASYKKCLVADNIGWAVEYAKSMGQDLVVVGGQSIYEQCMPLANILYQTVIDVVVNGGDAFSTKIPNGFNRVRTVVQTCPESHVKIKTNTYIKK